MTKLYSRHALTTVNYDQREITQTVRGSYDSCSAIPNIATNMHTFQVIPTQDNNVMPCMSKKCYENKDQSGNN